MDEDLKKGWTEIVEADDLDAHMREVEQAEVNAKLAEKMLAEVPLAAGGRLLVHGCGTGQMFDFVEPRSLGRYRFVFADLNPRFLEKLKKRLARFEDVEFEVVEDDIEDTKLEGKFDGVLTILLLEHIDWKLGLRAIGKLGPEMIYLVILEQDEGKEVVTKHGKLRKSIKEFAEVAKPHLVPRGELVDYLGELGYDRVVTREVRVPNGKKMVGLVFRRRVEKTNG